jgi:hypothetical protein
MCEILPRRDKNRKVNDMKISALLVLCAAFVLPTYAHADTYQYVGVVGAYPGVFTFDSPELILTPTTVTPISCYVTSGIPGVPNYACDSITLIPFYSGTGEYEEGSIEFDENGKDLFEDPAPYSTFFTTVGYNTYGPYDTLTITDLSTTATPEPSSLLMLGTGVLGMAGVVRRRFRKA